MKTMSKKTIITTITILVIVIGGGIAIKRAKNRDASAPVAKNYDVVVSTMKVKSDEIKLTLPYLAIVQNDKDVMIASKIPARVEYIKPSGSKVHKGELIVKLDNTTVLSNINSVKAQLDAVNVALNNMTATHNRTLELLKVNGASIEQSQREESKLSELKSKKEALTQKLNELYNMSGYANIKSPVTGIISKTMVNVGDMAMPGHPIANLKSDNGFFLLIRVPTDVKIVGVETGNKRFDAIPLNSTFNGLSEYKAYADIPNLTSGDRLEVNVELYNGKGILLPFDAIINRNGKSYVLVRNGNIAKAHEVNVVESGEQGIIIANNELIGEEVVIAKQDILLKLLSGVSLKVKEE